MLKFKEIFRELKTVFYQSFSNRIIKINLNKAIISFSFDDVPRSAIINGIPLLDKYGIKATFYVSMGLSENIANTNRAGYLNASDVRALHNAGHHIACHTYSHFFLEKDNAHEFVLDADKNINRLHSILGPAPIEHFSYPFGKVNFIAKKLLAKTYKTMRSTRPGINKSLTDMFLLRATRLYNEKFDKNLLIDIIRKTERSGGWLIFYTHGVEKNPDEYSCTSEQFKWILQACIASSAEILPIDQAYNKITANCTSEKMIL